MLKEMVKRYYHGHIDNRFLRQGLISFRKLTRANKKIKIIFICQMPQLWNKISDVYYEMLQDSRIEVYIVVVPDVSVSQENQENSIRFFKGIKGKIIVAKTVNGWYPIRNIKPNYVFYQRRYDAYLPEEYRSFCVAAYARVCYIPYAYACTKPVEHSCYNQDFFANVYMFFAENGYAKKLIIEREKELYAKKQKNAYYLGYPALDNIRKSKGIKGHFWMEDDPRYKILWCPRWTTDVNLGASNFFEYKDFFIEWVNKRKNTSVVFRPHPMMFSNFEKTGEMSGEEAKQYLNNYMEHERLMYDNYAEYYTTLWNSDVLVADLTTVIIEYFVVRKPIIYCVADIEYNDFMKKVISGCYCVHNGQELADTLDMLERGEDPLLDERNRIADYLLKGKEDTAKVIVSKIKEDFYSGK
ncbi:CDP-glycerol glycerophosphotransferase family protein [Sporofaciens musculi]|uniref:CDP-glycerol glycerophosphotransferase family protein n=1 Tax=Sporofaciens musculi TaxID=2681861 RepID=UPI0025A0D644|nr:CDP-glycerol glycerophosphotransferase family protein [Sporofaciens musculi]